MNECVFYLTNITNSKKNLNFLITFSILIKIISYLHKCEKFINFRYDL